MPLALLQKRERNYCNSSFRKKWFDIFVLIFALNKTTIKSVNRSKRLYILFYFEKEVYSCQSLKQHTDKITRQNGLFTLNPIMK